MNTSCLLSSSWGAKENKGVLVHNVIPLPQHACSLPFSPKMHLKPLIPWRIEPGSLLPPPSVPKRGPLLLSEGLLQFPLLEQRVGRRPVCCWVGGEGFFQGWELGAGGAAEEEAANGSAGTGPVAMAVLGICDFSCPLPASPVAHTTQRQREKLPGVGSLERRALHVNGCPPQPRQVPPERACRWSTGGGNA